MWMVNPSLMCRKHLLGEHVELHMAGAWIAKGKSVAGWAESNCLEPLSIGIRHSALAAEMRNRGYNHKSPLSQPNVAAHQCPNAIVDKAAALAELALGKHAGKISQRKRLTQSMASDYYSIHGGE
jgi:hypothetical protein